MLKSHRSALLLILSIPFLLPTTGSSQEPDRVTIQGTVVDSRSGLPIPEVEVTLAELGVVLVTDSVGAFLFPDLALGTYHMALERAGYKGIEGPLQVMRAGSMVIGLDPLAATGDPESSRIHGTVKDLDSGALLEGAQVTIQGKSQITDADGRFVLDGIPAGGGRLEVSLMGYATRSDSVVVPPGSLLTLDVGLAVEPIHLAPISVSVERRNLDLEVVGFYERRERERGYFFTREAIEERNPVTVADLFEGMPGVRIVSRHGLRRAVSLTGRRAMSLLHDPKMDPSTPCYPSVWMNGMLVHQGTDTVPADLEGIVNPGDIAGLEVYQTTARIPVQYNVQGSCGVIVIWTRSGGGRGPSPQPSPSPEASGRLVRGCEARSSRRMSASSTRSDDPRSPEWNAGNAVTCPGCLAPPRRGRGHGRDPQAVPPGAEGR